MSSKLLAGFHKMPPEFLCPCTGMQEMQVLYIIWYFCHFRFRSLEIQYFCKVCFFMKDNFFNLTGHWTVFCSDHGGGKGGKVIWIGVWCRSRIGRCKGATTMNFLVLIQMSRSALWPTLPSPLQLIHVKHFHPLGWTSGPHTQPFHDPDFPYTGTP